VCHPGGALQNRNLCARNGPDQRGTAGWIRTTDLLIHSLYQLVDFSRVCGKSKDDAHSAVGSCWEILVLPKSMRWEIITYHERAPEQLVRLAIARTEGGDAPQEPSRDFPKVERPGSLCRRSSAVEEKVVQLALIWQSRARPPEWGRILVSRVSAVRATRRSWLA
jgi:hypothetical protein